MGNLVRLPVLKELVCPSTPELACKLSGANLFLVDSVSNDPGFAHPVPVPNGFLGSALPVPHPTAGPLYVKLRDNPSVINSTTLAMQQLPVSPGELEHAGTRQPALSTPALSTPAVSTPAPAEKAPMPQRSNEADPATQQHNPDP